MALYQYVKAVPRGVRRRRKKPYALSFFLMTTGVGILLWVGWPILSFVILSQSWFSQTVTPIPEHPTASKSITQTVLAASADDPVSPVDFTNVNAWFPTKPQKKIVTPVNTYRLSIPKLNIKNASVVIGGDDLGKSLIHYGGSALPGDYGTSLIFGHSTLVQFYNPTDYKTIFATIPALKAGDEFFVEYDGVTYRYKIYEMTVLDPTDLSGLEQHFDDSYITLVTCVPPGTLWKRLYVKGKLVHL